MASNGFYKNLTISCNKEEMKVVDKIRTYRIQLKQIFMVGVRFTAGVITGDNIFELSTRIKKDLDKVIS